MKRPTKKPDGGWCRGQCQVEASLMMHRRLLALNVKIEAEVQAMRKENPCTH